MQTLTRYDDVTGQHYIPVPYFLTLPDKRSSAPASYTFCMTAWKINLSRSGSQARTWLSIHHQNYTKQDSDLARRGAFQTSSTCYNGSRENSREVHSKDM